MPVTQGVYIIHASPFQAHHVSSLGGGHFEGMRQDDGRWRHVDSVEEA